MKILVTGGAGFIGSAFVRLALSKGDQVVVLDKLTYAGHRENLEDISESFEFFEDDIANGERVGTLIQNQDFDWIVNFAAESHVDRSISGPAPFIQTNVLGTFQLLEHALQYWKTLRAEKKEKFRFLQISTDEVFGQLGDTGYFTEQTPYQPSSPYSASKASADHLARAWHHTFGLPTLVTNCSNNYGPRQLPEKLIPLMITYALRGKNLPVYGEGGNVRDWIHVDDHCRGIYLALEKGTPGDTYCFGGESERNNLDVVKEICKHLDQKKPLANKKSYVELISFVKDRPGHDWRYAIDHSFAKKTLGFRPEYRFESGLEQTIDWYMSHSSWVEKILSKGRLS